MDKTLITEAIIMTIYSASLVAAWTDFLPESLRKYMDGPLGIVILLAVGAVLIFLLAWLFSFVWRGIVGTGSGPRPNEQNEDLAGYPPPPPVGTHQLTIDGIPVRVRLIIVAPVGQDLTITQDNVHSVLEEVVPGLGNVALSDKPRVVIWPTQLSMQGFAPTFHRITEKPEADGQPSPWVLAAGPAHAGSRKILLGMALLSEQHTVLGRRTLQPDRWPEMLNVNSTAG